LLILDEETAEIEADVHGWIFRFHVTFHPNAEGERVIRQEVEKDHLHLHFNKWVESIGTATISPFEVATLSDGRKVRMMLYHHKVGHTNSVQVQITTGAAHG